MAAWLNERTKYLIVGPEQLEEKALDRGARGLDATAEHAVAGVEGQADADGHALGGELGHFARQAVLVNFEGLARQIRRQLALGVVDRRRDRDDLDAGSIRLVRGEHLRRRGTRRARPPVERTGDQGEPDGAERGDGTHDASIIRWPAAR